MTGAMGRSAREFLCEIEGIGTFLPAPRCPGERGASRQGASR
jgi:hypothetical protein